MTEEGKKFNPLLIVTIVLGFLVIVLCTSTIILLLNKNNNVKCRDENPDNQSIEFSGDLTVSLAKKVEESKTYIFDSDHKIGDYKINNYPVINIATSSVSRLNLEIEQSYREKIDIYKSYSYFYKIYNKYLSVVCYYNDGNIPVIDKAYVVDLTTGLVFNNDHLLELFGYKYEEVSDKALQTAFTNFDKDLNIMAKTYSQISEDDKNKMLVITSDTLNSRFYFIDSSGRIYQLYTCANYTDKGLSGNFKTIDLDEFSLAIYTIK